MMVRLTVQNRLSKTMVSTDMTKPLHPSKALAALIGSRSVSRTGAVRQVWAYIRDRNLLNPHDGLEIAADSRLRAVIGQDKATIFDLLRLLRPHLRVSTSSKE